MTFNFWKMHGAGNDFILVDDREQTFPAADREWVKMIAGRKTGVGCEGIILIQNSSVANFRMRFFNPDGSEVDMCGNGARCVARLAYEIGVAPAAMEIETGAGILKAAMANEQVLLYMTTPHDWRLQRRIAVSTGALDYSFVNSGVPHVVITVNDLDGVDVRRLGSEIRYHNDFAPAGTNVNFIRVTGLQTLRIRTYERGVEDETMACGTGIVAAALVAGKLGAVKPPVSVTCASGDILDVNYTVTPDSAEQVTLLGPAVHVFQGTLEY